MGEMQPIEDPSGTGRIEGSTQEVLTVPVYHIPEWRQKLVDAEAFVSSLISGGETGFASVVDKAVQSGIERPNAITALNILTTQGEIEVGWDLKIKPIPEGQREVWIEADAD